MIVGFHVGIAKYHVQSAKMPVIAATAATAAAIAFIRRPGVTLWRQSSRESLQSDQNHSPCLRQRGKGVPDRNHVAGHFDFLFGSGVLRERPLGIEFSGQAKVRRASAVRGADVVGVTSDGQGEDVIVDLTAIGDKSPVAWAGKKIVRPGLAEVRLQAIVPLPSAGSDRSARGCEQGEEFVILDVEVEGESHLSEIASALGRARIFLGSNEGWQQQSSQDCDDRDDNEQFDQSKSTRRVGGITSCHSGSKDFQHNCDGGDSMQDMCHTSG